MELYRKHRPKTLKGIIGNKTTIASIKAKIEEDALPHALLFTGASGTGKTTIAKAIANEIGCKGTDLHEIDTADFRSIDTVRSIRSKVGFPPTDGKAVVWILDEIHMLGVGGDSKKNAAQNAMLKLLERAPEHTYFMLCTTNPEMLITTIRNRCTVFEMDLLSTTQCSKLIKRIARKEKRNIPDKIAKQIAKASGGSARKTLTILDQIFHLPEKQMGKFTVDIEQQEANAIELARILFKGGSWKETAKILNGLQNANTEGIRQMILSYMTSIMKKSVNQRAHFIFGCFDEPLYDNMNRLWYLCHGIINDLEI